MVIKRKDFQKAAAFIHEFLLKLNEDGECAELRDTLNLALLHMQKYYRKLQSRSQEKNCQATLQFARGLSPLTPFVDTPDKFQWKWINLDMLGRFATNMSGADSINFVTLPNVIEAAKNGTIEELENIIAQDPECINLADGIGRSALTYAVHFDQDEALNVLLESNADVNMRAHDGSTALHRACHDGNHVALSLLLDYGGDFSVQDTNDRAPIHWAVTTPSHECLTLLLERLANVGVRDQDGLTPSMWACRMDNIKHFELISRCETCYVAEPDGIERDNSQRTWMHWSVRRTEPLECLQTLLTASTATLKDVYGKTVLHVAAEMGSLAACRVIMEIADKTCVLDRDNNGQTALHLATIGGHGDVVNFLLEQGIDLNVEDHLGATAWNYARNQQLHYCQLILMSHQRQRLSNNRGATVSKGMGLIDNISLVNGDMQMHPDFYNSRESSWKGKSGNTTPITPPHPPKRPRTGRLPITRRAKSLSTSQQGDPSLTVNAERAVNSAGKERKKERIEVSIDTKRASGMAFYNNGREESAMLTDEQYGEEAVDEDVDAVSVGGMDVSDIDDDEARPKSPTVTGQTQPLPMRPCPPPRYRTPHMAAVSYPQEPSYPASTLKRNHADHKETESQNDIVHDDIDAHPPPHRYVSNPTQRQQGQQQQHHQQQQQQQVQQGPIHEPFRSGLMQRQQLYQGHGLYRSGRGGVIPSAPSNIPQRPHAIRQHVPLPAHPGARDHPVAPPRARSREREQVGSPPLSSGSDQPSGKSGPRGTSPDEANRPNSGGTKPPGILEGRRIQPPPMLTPLPNAPKPPNGDRFEKAEKKKKKKRLDKEQDTKSPPQNPLDIPQPRGYAAPLHPFPQGQQQGRVQSGLPSGPRISKHEPQYHEPRHAGESADEDPVVNGYSVGTQDVPASSPQKTGDKSQPMEGEDTYDDGNADNYMQPCIAEEDELESGPLIPPPQGFQSTIQGRQLSQSVPQPFSRKSSAPKTSGHETIEDAPYQC
ncbi:uncharacterized protein LOC121391294 isoform X2 [Gigantopelta aegis]|uniref:uncharacterized protein LOC121391294 isoform X2 n=1 Tax=Gigantopelta aegis TaxID=1735272 RepID=UPI001B88B19C|nr:uncharacterized protein LOC121391294 isoform X2 [Gigantopelta aegis]